ncbi:MAG TPA: 3',5'-nucleoside bisphosphate phosphatase [Burkholderiales bacterium]|nr:3',5'-nucleoside bisphosphate phosphatase [Burkholderiales bacterium]
MKATLNYDLHCHSTGSDGLLSPANLVRRAVEKGVDVLALTDHDNLGGLAEAAATAAEHGLAFVPGVEISTSWNDITIHIVGLGIDVGNQTLVQGLAGVRSSRGSRAERIAAGLGEAGVPNALEGAMAFCENPSLISRTHFARYLVSIGYASDVKSVFQHYLTPGKPGYVAHDWASIAEAVRWIRAADGQAVVAHPGRYKLNPLEMKRLLSEFKDAGGAGIEVITGSHSPEQYGEYALRAREFGFLASRGSDFHGPGETRLDLGQLPPLPADLRPIWHQGL